MLELYLRFLPAFAGFFAIGVLFGEWLERRRARLVKETRDLLVKEALDANRALVDRLGSSFDNLTYGAALQYKANAERISRPAPLPRPEQPEAIEPLPTEADMVDQMTDAQFIEQQRKRQFEARTLFDPDQDF